MVGCFLPNLTLAIYVETRKLARPGRFPMRERRGPKGRAAAGIGPAQRCQPLHSGSPRQLFLILDVSRRASRHRAAIAVNSAALSIGLDWTPSKPSASRR